jgi:carbonic anhydrase
VGKYTMSFNFIVLHFKICTPRLNFGCFKMDINKIFVDNKKWIASKLDKDSAYFDELAAGQNPSLLYIGCSDSRVTAEEIMGLGPGEAFILRNIANMVNNIDLSAMAVINYAVSVLEVDHIVVCGHYNCGGVKAAMASQNLGILNPWLRSIRDVYRLHHDELDAIKDEPKKHNRLVELNVIEQCINVVKTSDVQIAVKNRNLTVHGWVFDLKTGQIIDLDFNYKSALKEITEVYKII